MSEEERSTQNVRIGVVVGDFDFFSKTRNDNRSLRCPAEIVS